MLLPFIGVIVFTGIYPKPMLDRIEPPSTASSPTSRSRPASRSPQPAVIEVEPSDEPVTRRSLATRRGRRVTCTRCSPRTSSARRSTGGTQPAARARLGVRCCCSLVGALTPTWPRGCYAALHGGRRRSPPACFGAVPVGRRSPTTGRRTLRQRRARVRRAHPVPRRSPSAPRRCWSPWSRPTTCAARASTAPRSTRSA